MKIVADNKIPFLNGVFEPFAEVVYLPGAKISKDDLSDADALITRTRTKCNADLLQASPVKVVATATIGTDHVDEEYLAASKIAFFSAPGCNSSSVRQYVCSALLNLAEKHQINLAGKTLGIIGVGHVGSKVAQMAKALGMKVLLNDPPRAAVEGQAGFSELAEVMAQADFITVHVPLDATTFHLANEKFFASMRDKSFFINSSRGTVCDNPALKAALKSGKLSGAVLDVWENEPEIDLELLNILDFATMHIAGYSADGKANGTMMSVQSVAKVLKIKALEIFEKPFLRAADNYLIEIPENLTAQQRLLFAVNQSYNIADDSAKLKNHPENFEKLRNDYHYRREFVGFTVKNPGMQAETFKELWFNLA